jgi:AcrR family transcriptional regulator
MSTVYTYYVYTVDYMRRSPNSAPSKTNTAASILAVARKLLDREGLEAVAMRPVAKKVGITPMAIYRHFTDRASLLNAISEEGFHDLSVRVQALRLTGSVEARLVQVADLFLDAALQFPNLYKLMFLSPREGARVYPRDFKAGRSPTFNPTVKIIEEAMRAGELRPDDPMEIAFEISALSHGLIMLYLGGRIAMSAKKFRIFHQHSFRRYLDGLRP